MVTSKINGQPNNYNDKIKTGKGLALSKWLH